jgi:hypothetical protein
VFLYNMQMSVGSVVGLLLSASALAGCATSSPNFGHRRAAGTPSSSIEPAALDCKKQQPDGGIEVSNARALARRGYDDQRFSDRVSTADKPIEVCGYAQQLSWLTAMHCNDGSRPWGDDVEAAHAARRGSLQPDDIDSSCLHPIDAYEVKCPEQTYIVYNNLYVCPANEGVMDNWGRNAS